MTEWTEQETSFLSSSLYIDTKELILQFFEEFGLGRSSDSVRNKIKRLRERAAKDIVRDSAENDSPLSLLDPYIAKQQAGLWLRAIASESSGFSFCRTPPIKSNNRSLVLMISDVHWGKQTKTYNMNIADQRILSIPETLRSKTLPDFDEIVVLLLGDLVEGEDIHAHQNSVNEAPVITAYKRGTRTIWRLLLLLKQLFDTPIRVETDPGNHGRMSKSSHPHSNWDNAIYESLAMISEFSGDIGISINVNLEDFCVVEVKNKKILLSHRGVKHAGTPAMTSKIAGWAISKDIDIVAHGHWHSYAFDSYIDKLRISNGSVVGPDDLAESMAKEDPPRQAYFIVDPNIPGGIDSSSFIQW
jgi:hypothetical protein